MHLLDWECLSNTCLNLLMYSCIRLKLYRGFSWILSDNLMYYVYYQNLIYIYVYVCIYSFVTSRLRFVF